jgi:hypothetical protein
MLAMPMGGRMTFYNQLLALAYVITLNLTVLSICAIMRNRMLAKRKEKRKVKPKETPQADALDKLSSITFDEWMNGFYRWLATKEK